MIYMILFSIFKSLADAVKPDQFDASIFVRWKGHRWFDLRAAETKYHNMPTYLYIFYILFGDLWHFANTGMIVSFILGLYYFEPTAYNLFSHVVFMFVVYGITFELTRLFLMGKNYKYK